MKFKTDEIAEQWRKPIVPVGSTPHKVAKAQNFATWIDHTFQLLGWGEITITDYLREANPNKKSFHPRGQAFDIRIHHLSTDQRKQAIRLFAALWNADNELQVDPHYNMWSTPNEHFHCEVDDKNPL